MAFCLGLPVSQSAVKNIRARQPQPDCSLGILPTLHPRKLHSRISTGTGWRSFTVRHTALMQTVESFLADASFRSEETRVFQMVIAYGDFANGRCAMNFFDRIVAEFGKMFIFVPSFLKFEELLWPEVGDRVVREAAEADMVVIAAYEEADLPSLVKDWLGTWEKVEKRNETALVALLSASQDSTVSRTPVRSHLRQVARRAGMKFFCNHHIGWPRKDVQFPLEIIHRADRGGQRSFTSQPFTNAGGRNGEELERRGNTGTTRREAILCHGKALDGETPVSRELIGNSDSSAMEGRSAVAYANL